MAFETRTQVCVFLDDICDQISWIFNIIKLNTQKSPTLKAVSSSSDSGLDVDWEFLIIPTVKPPSIKKENLGWPSPVPARPGEDPLRL